MLYQCELQTGWEHASGRTQQTRMKIFGKAARVAAERDYRLLNLESSSSLFGLLCSVLTKQAIAAQGLP